MNGGTQGSFCVDLCAVCNNEYPSKAEDWFSMRLFARGLVLRLAGLEV